MRETSSVHPLRERPIGVFDSGVGGLSVVREIRGLLPSEDVIYVADRAHCPYGTRSRREIMQLAEANSRFLVEQGAKLIVVACNTASVAALAHLRATFSVPFVGIVPAVKPAAQLTRTGKVGILATQATIQGELFAQLIRDYAPGVEVLPMVCPGLVELAEQGDVAGEQARELVTSYVRPLVEAGADTLVLGCTHYPFYRPLVEEVAGTDVVVIDTGLPVARQVARVLEARGTGRQGGEGSVRYFTTETDVSGYRQVVARLLGQEPETVGHAAIQLAAVGALD